MFVASTEYDAWWNRGGKIGRNALQNWGSRQILGWSQTCGSQGADQRLLQMEREYDRMPCHWYLQSDQRIACEPSTLPEDIQFTTQFF